MESLLDFWTMEEINFLAGLHNQTRRDYVARVVEHDKVECATVAKQWGRDYWDGERQYGYGGYRYDGRWRSVAEQMVQHYGLTENHSILDIGCGKGYLLYEFTQVVPGIQVSGIDISNYAIEQAKEEIKPYLKITTATDLPYADGDFDFVYSLNVFHNFAVYDLKAAVSEMMRVGRQKHYLCVESYRNEREKVNLLYWQLTCASFYSTEEWKWLLEKWGYTGDVGFIFFE
ncbi:class I SAM-dependent methyltransferase [Kaarinaea lacus]